VRLPSTMRPDLGGDARYAMAVLTPHGAGGGRLQRGRLENQPDAVAIHGDLALRRQFSAFLADRATHAAVDAGLALLPEALTARRATSAAPHGLTRKTNRPFTAIASDADIQALGAGDAQLGAQRLRRLDQQSCSGCHHARSVAGFHLLGVQADRVVGRLALAASPHLQADLPRREAWIRTLLRGPQLPNGVAPDPRRPPAEAPVHDGVVGPARHGERCGLRLERAWKCEAPLLCQQIDDADVGVCLPKRPAIGDPCAPGLVAHGKKGDFIGHPTSLSCGAGYCESAQVGFPSGLCAAGCAGKSTPDVVCAGIPGIIEFNSCLARGAPFSQCAGDALRPARLRRCDLDVPCRDDYACAIGPSGAGACMPPYFLQEIRVDGHARTRKGAVSRGQP
jgi:hypothetical protein